MLIEKVASLEVEIDGWYGLMLMSTRMSLYDYDDNGGDDSIKSQKISRSVFVRVCLSACGWFGLVGRVCFTPKLLLKMWRRLMMMMRMMM